MNFLIKLLMFIIVMILIGGLTGIVELKKTVVDEPNEVEDNITSELFNDSYNSFTKNEAKKAINSTQRAEDIISVIE